MKEDSVMARSDSVAEGLGDQKESWKLEAEQRNLAMGVREMKEVAKSTAANAAIVLQLPQHGGVVPAGRAPGAGESPKEWTDQVLKYILAEVVLSAEYLYIFFKRKSKFLRHLISAVHAGTDYYKNGWGYVESRNRRRYNFRSSL